MSRFVKPVKVEVIPPPEHDLEIIAPPLLTREEITALDQMAVREEIKAHFRRMYKLQLVSSPEVFNDPRILATSKFLAKAEESSDKKKGPLVLFTINPPEPNDFPSFMRDFEDKALKFTDRVWVNKFWFVFETRGLKDGYPTGVHLHFLLDRGEYIPSHCIRDIKNSFKHFVADPDNSHHINIKFAPASDLPNILQYLSGVKKGVNKKHALDDVIFRRTFELLPLYSPETLKEVDPDPDSDH